MLFSATKPRYVDISKVENTTRRVYFSQCNLYNQMSVSSRKRPDVKINGFASMSHSIQHSFQLQVFMNGKIN